VITELHEGTMVLWPTPSFIHQEAVLNLAIALRAACPPELRVIVGPMPVRVNADTELSQDVIVARYVDVTTDTLTAPPVLVAEVRIPGTGQIDRSWKKAAYARHGVLSYWLVDPEPPDITAYNLVRVSGKYSLAGYAAGPEFLHTAEPFRLSINPNNLVRGIAPN
jgi:Uma2 family endonuclease